jgi:AP-3 complex subunit beta
MSLARYDQSYDLRDRARLLKNVHLSPLREAALHTPKPVPRMETFGERGAEWALGSMAQVISRDVQGEMKLPEWGSEVPEEGVRDVPEVSHGTAVVASGPAVATSMSSEREEKKKEKKVWKDLDKFYASESEGDEEEKTEEDEEESEEGSEVEDSEEESEEDDSDEGSRQPLTSGWR